MNAVRLQFVSRPARLDLAIGRKKFEPLLKVTAGFGAAVLVLFTHVWLPIQAERSLVQLRRMESQVSLKKAELNELNDRYARLTSLTTLDQWAKKHGPWVPAQVHNVLTIEK